MSRFFYLPFTFRSKDYYMLVRSSKTQDKMCPRVTMMNGNIVKLNLININNYYAL